MEKLSSTTWLGRVVALHGLLEIVSKMSLSMQTLNVIPWELMSEQRDFYDKMVSMESALREQPKETDPHWRSSPPDPIPLSVFHFFHEEPDPKLPGQPHIQHLIEGTYMVHKLAVPGPSERHTSRVYMEYMTD